MGAKKYFFFKNSPTFTQILKCVSNTTPIKHLKRRAERRTKPSLSDPSDYSWGSKKKSEWKRKNSFICVIYQVFFTSSAHCLLRKSAHYHLFPKRWWNYHDNRNFGVHPNWVQVITCPQVPLTLTLIQHTKRAQGSPFCLFMSTFFLFLIKIRMRQLSNSSDYNMRRGKLVGSIDLACLEKISQ